MKSIKKKLYLGILSLLIISSMLGFFINPTTAHTEESPFITNLIAGGGNPEKPGIDVGDIIVWNDGEFLYVKYETIDDWYLVETNLEVKTSLEEIPQTQPNKVGMGGGNPIPGQFEWKREYCPPEQSDLFTIDLEGWDIDTQLYIAAHAKVIHIRSNAAEIIFKTCIFYDYIDMEESAWGDGLDFPGSNWATYFTYTVQPYEELWPEGGTATIAFEDLPLGDVNIDYDYNDFVVDVSIIGTYSYLGLYELEMTFEAQARGAAYHHNLHLFFSANTFTSNGIYSIEYYETDGSLISSMGSTYDNTEDFDITVFGDTWLALPPNIPPPEGWAANTFDNSGIQAGRKTIIRLAFENPINLDLNTYSPEYVNVHGNNLFFDPYLNVTSFEGEIYEIHIADQRFIVVPTDWEWPQETVPIWEVYPYNSETSQGIISGNPPIFTTYWYTQVPTSLKWTP